MDTDTQNYGGAVTRHLAVIAEELGTVQVRNMRRGESVPLPHGFQHLDPDWTWVLTWQGDTVGAVLAAPCHGLVMLVRVVMLPGHGELLPRLLRHCVKEWMRRGFTGYFTYLGDNEAEHKLRRILSKGKVMEIPQQTCVGGDLSVLGRY